MPKKATAKPRAPKPSPPPPTRLRADRMTAEEALAEARAERLWLYNIDQLRQSAEYEDVYKRHGRHYAENFWLIPTVNEMACIKEANDAVDEVKQKANRNSVLGSGVRKGLKGAKPVRSL